MLLLAVVGLEIPLALTMRDRVYGEVRSEAESQADVAATSSSELMDRGERDRLNALVAKASNSAKGRVIVVDRAGRLIADSSGKTRLGDSYASRPEILSALRGRRAQRIRRSETLKGEILATAVPIVSGGRTSGAVRITQSIDSVNRAVRKTVLGLALIGLVVLLIGLAAGLVIAGQIARPLRRLESAARRVTEGDLKTRAEVEGSSEQRSLSHSFNEMTERLQTLLENQREFVANASHQLRTPLAALRLRIEEVQQFGTEPTAGKDLAAAIDEVDRLAKIVDELLVLSQAGEQRLPGEPVNLTVAAKDAVERWRRFAEGQNKEIYFVEQSTADQDLLHAPLPKVWTSRGDLDRMLDILIENAVLYSAPASEIEVAVERGSLVVRDRGPGISPAEISRLFERFYRGQAGRSGPAGTGLGLAIARQLARSWSGEIELSNREDCTGTVARLTLPKRNPRKLL